ncbi:MAG TPA: SDR family oxidoreductase [Anaerolineaceae bacterium]|nr:SDR family oxidoreductase [Anaerolineaceae bacterium]
MPTPLISTGTLLRDQLAGRVAIVSGAGRGIGFEAARALAWLGAQVVIAEMDRKTGLSAAARINTEFGRDCAVFIPTDIGSERSVADLARQIDRRLGRVDIILNNACLVRIGAVDQTKTGDWDASYRVNLLGPVMLAQQFIPGMRARRSGVFVCVTSKGVAYMGPYEVMKAAQLHLADTLAAELEGSGVLVFAIGPGLVRTPGAEQFIPQIAPLYGKSVDEFYEMNRAHILPVEAAGAGFAAAIALADRFCGQEIGSIQALIAAGIDVKGIQADVIEKDWTEEAYSEALDLARRLTTTLAEQAEGWQKRPLFERQWVIRDFRKHAGMPVEEWLHLLERLSAGLEARDPAAVAGVHAPIDVLAGYFKHLQDQYAGYEKDPQKLKETLPILEGWEQDARKLMKLFS